MIGAQLIHVFGGILIWIVGIAIIRHMRDSHAQPAQDHQHSDRGCKSA
jgi:hypothetical protein